MSVLGPKNKLSVGSPLVLSVVHVHACMHECVRVCLSACGGQGQRITLGVVHQYFYSLLYLLCFSETGSLPNLELTN